MANILTILQITFILAQKTSRILYINIIQGKYIIPF